MMKTKFVPTKHVLIMGDDNVSPMLSINGVRVAYDTELKSIVEIEDNDLIEVTIQNDTSEQKPKEPSTFNKENEELPKKWTNDNAVYYLLDLWKSHERHFKEGRLRHEVVWKMISTEMNKAGYMYDGSQCENKFKDLRKRYIKVKDCNEQSGAEPKYWKYYDRIDELFGDKPNVKPIALASNRKKRALHSDSDSDRDSVEDSKKENLSKMKRKKVTKVERQMKAWADIMLEQNDKKREDQNRRQEETQSMLKKMLESNNDFFNKLFDKL